MNTKILSKIFISCLILILLMACSEDFLEMEKKGGTPQEEFYQTDDDALSAISAAYDIMQSMWAEDWQSAWMVKVLPGDEVNTGGGNATDQPPFQNLNKFAYGPNNTPIKATYFSCYFGIYRCNKILEKVADDTETKMLIKAEAKTLRAYYYFELVTMFGSVPLLTEPLPPGVFSKAPAEISEIWTQIETDLTEAIPVLMTKKDLVDKYGAAHAARATKGTAQALLGKAHLYQEEWADASTQFENVISSGEYWLVKDFSQVLRKETEFGSESIFEISYATDQKNDWGNFKWGQGRRQENNIHWQLCGPRDFNGGSTGILGGWGFCNPKQLIYDAFTTEDSIRRKASVMSEAELIAAGGNWRTNGELPYGSEGIIRLKYGQWKDETDVTVVAELNYGTNIRLIRLADVFLMHAEANYHLNNTAAAYSSLDSITIRAGVAPIRSTGTQLLDDIKHQRRVELAFEGHRFADLVRWGDAVTVLGSKGYTAKFALYPIPKAELDRNVEMKQSALWK